MQEYASWYLLRNGRKTSSVITPAMRRDPVAEMWLHHEHKMRNWFDASTIWNIVELENANELGNLVFLESDWTRNEGLVQRDGTNYRLLDRVATNAISSGYLDRSSDERHRKYYEQLAVGSLELKGENRVAICSAEPSETTSNPSADYYLLDGAGRCLPYTMLVKQNKLGFAPIEPFLARRRDKEFQSRLSPD